MARDRSRQKLLEFLDYLANKGLMAKPTVAARKAAANKILGILTDEEAADVVELDLDQVVKRFQNLAGQNYTPASLSAYRSRLRSAIDDFDSYVENPLGFRPSVQAREKRPKPDGKKDKPVAENSDQTADFERPSQRSPAPLSNTILPIPIRSDITIYVQGIPFDLTESEAAKIANVIRALATPA